MIMRRIKNKILNRSQMISLKGYSAGKESHKNLMVVKTSKNRMITNRKRKKDRKDKKGNSI